MNTEYIEQSLKEREDLQGWAIRATKKSGAQLYTIPDGIEGIRTTSSSSVAADILKQHADSADRPSSGTATVYIGQSDDVAAKIAEGATMAGRSDGR